MKQYKWLIPLLLAAVLLAGCDGFTTKPVDLSNPRGNATAAPTKQVVQQTPEPTKQVVQETPEPTVQNTPTTVPTMDWISLARECECWISHVDQRSNAFAQGLRPEVAVISINGKKVGPQNPAKTMLLTIPVGQQVEMEYMTIERVVRKITFVQDDPSYVEVRQNTPVQTPTASPTASASAPVSQANGQQVVSPERAKRIEDLYQVYLEGDLEKWLRMAGFEFESLQFRSAQPVEEVINGHVRPVGHVVYVTKLSFRLPCVMSSDNPLPEGTIWVQPDPQNASKVATNVVNFTGTATLYVDGSNWGQFTKGQPNATQTPKATSSPTPTRTVTHPSQGPSRTPMAPTAVPSCLKMADLAKLGEIISQLEYPQGTLAGAQIKFSQDYQVAPGWTLQKDGKDVQNVKAGEVASLWSPLSCRPLAR
jgi:hypothetical protein